MNYIEQQKTTVRKYFLAIRQDGKERMIHVTEQVAREARKFKDRKEEYAQTAFFDLQDKDGNYVESFDRNEFKGIRTEAMTRDMDISKKGYYCEWGAWHGIENRCQHFAITGVPPDYMQRMKQKLFPNWQDGHGGRPEKHIKTNAMTQFMQNTIINHYNNEKIN